MNKKDWKEALDKIKELLKTAKDNKEMAEKQIEELTCVKEAYEAQIKSA